MNVAGRQIAVTGGILWKEEDGTLRIKDHAIWQYYIADSQCPNAEIWAENHLHDQR